MPRRKRDDRFWFGEINEAFLAQLYSTTGWFTFCSEGGDMHIMTAAIDRLRAHPLKLKVTGTCFSAAVPILAAGTRRLASPFTRFMVHPGFIDSAGKSEVRDLRTDARELQLLEDFYLSVLAETTSRSSDWWKEKSEQTYYFGAEEAKEIGLIDRIE